MKKLKIPEIRFCKALNLQRLDSTQMLGRVSKMNRLDCVQESLRLALQEVAKGLAQAARPALVDQPVGTLCGEPRRLSRQRPDAGP